MLRATSFSHGLQPTKTFPNTSQAQYFSVRNMRRAIEYLGVRRQIVDCQLLADCTRSRLQFPTPVAPKQSAGHWAIDSIVLPSGSRLVLNEVISFLANSN